MNYTDSITGKQHVVRDPSDLLISTSKHLLKLLNDKSGGKFKETSVLEVSVVAGVEYLVTITDNEFVSYFFLEIDSEPDTIGFFAKWLKSDTTPFSIEFNKCLPEDSIKQVIEKLIAIF